MEISGGIFVMVILLDLWRVNFFRRCYVIFECLKYVGLDIGKFNKVFYVKK